MASVLTNSRKSAAYSIIALPLLLYIPPSVPFIEPLMSWRADSTAGIISFSVMLGIAIGASVYIVRRQPDNLFGWMGLVMWGGLVCLAVVGRLLQMH